MEEKCHVSADCSRNKGKRETLVLKVSPLLFWNSSLNIRKLMINIKSQLINLISQGPISS
jgi:hypothetical protein